MKIDKSKWEYKKLGEVCDKASSNIVLNKVKDVKGDYSLYGASGFVQTIDFYHQDKPYIGIVKDGSGVGRVNIYPAKSSLAGTMQYILPKDITNMFYLRSYLQHLHLERYATGAAIPHIYFKDYCKENIYLPPITIQRQIALELDKLNSLISMKQQQLKEFDTLAQSIFYQMFGDPANNEKGWKRNKFSDLFALKSGAGLSAKEQIEGRYPVYGGNGINGYHNIYNKNGKYIIIGRVGAYCGNVRLVNGCFWLTDNAFELIEKQDAQDKVFLKTLLTIMNLGKFAHKAAQPVISNVVLQNILFPLPPLPLQQTFAHKIEAIERQKTLVKSCIADLQELLAGKMDEYFG